MNDRQKFEYTALAVGPRVRLLRQLAGMSLEDLAERSGLSVACISLVENQKRGTSLLTLIKLADALGGDPASLLTAMPEERVVKVRGSEIRRIREGIRAIERKELAQAVGVHYHTLYRIEQHDKPTTPNTLFRIAHALKVGPGCLVDAGERSSRT
jgi:transcriptional regulator with XRE-family HTH domain